jgi:hypothetical protein
LKIDVRVGPIRVLDRNFRAYDTIGDVRKVCGCERKIFRVNGAVLFDSASVYELTQGGDGFDCADSDIGCEKPVKIELVQIVDERKLTFRLKTKDGDAERKFPIEEVLDKTVSQVSDMLLPDHFGRVEAVFVFAGRILPSDDDAKLTLRDFGVVGGETISGRMISPDEQSMTGRNWFMQSMIKQTPRTPSLKSGLWKFRVGEGDEAFDVSCEGDTKISDLQKIVAKKFGRLPGDFSLIAEKGNVCPHPMESVADYIHAGSPFRLVWCDPFDLIGTNVLQYVVEIGKITGIPEEEAGLLWMQCGQNRETFENSCRNRQNFLNGH